MTQIFKVLSQSEAISITKQDGSTISKSILVLQELGGKFENSYVCALLGPQYRFAAGDLVIAALRFFHREHNGTPYQDITVQEIIKIGD